MRRPLPSLSKPLRLVEARLRLLRAMNTGTLLLVPGAALATLALGGLKTGAVTTETAHAFLLAAAVIPLAGLLVGAIRPLPRLLAAQLLDRSHGLRSRIANACELAELSGDERTPFVLAAITDAEQRAESLRPALAVPFRRPRDLGPALAFLALLLVVSTLEVPIQRPQPAPTIAREALLDDDAVGGFKEELEELLARDDPQPEISSIAQELNRILEDIADRQLTRSDALREIASLERRLADGRSGDADAMEAALRELGARLSRSPTLTTTAAALAGGDASRAEAALRDLASRIEESAMTRAELEALRRTLERAARDRMAAERSLEGMEQERESLLDRRRQELEEESEPQLLRRRQRELEQLEREQSETAERRRRLERLRRELERAAQELQRQDQRGASEALSRGAEDLNRTAREQMTEQQRRELAAQMQQLREMIRRQREQQASGEGEDGEQGSGGEGGGRSLQRFVLRAQGEGSQGARLRMPGGEQGAGEQGEDQGGQGSGREPGQEGRGAEGGASGDRQGGGGPQELRVGQGGDAMLEIPGMGEGSGGAGTEASGGSGPGTDHDPNALGDPTHLRSRGQASRIEGAHGEGPSRSEVILGAADRGFAARPYRSVHSDYAGHAEEVLERDEIPSGYRFYVRRYFQLIRPRETPASETNQ